MPIGTSVAFIPRTVGIESYQCGNRVQSVEEEMWIDLIRKRNQSRFGQTNALELELFLCPETAPDADGERDSK